MEFTLSSAIPVLSRTPPTLQALLGGLPEAWTAPNEGPDTFSPFDVVGHLIDGEETDWMPRARIILAGDPEQTFTPYDRFRHYERNRGKPLGELLREFSDLRRRNVAELEGWKLTPAQLAATALHPGLGRVTLQQLLSTWVVHDLGHIAQVTRVMAKQYRSEVGPWVQYLPILTDHERPRS